MYYGEHYNYSLYSTKNYSTLERFSLEFYSCMKKIFPVYVQNKQLYHYFLCFTLIALYLQCRCTWKNSVHQSYYKSFENYS